VETKNMIVFVALMVSLSLAMNSFAFFKILGLLNRVKAIEAKLAGSNDEPADE
jgi:hypothetical protein